MIKGALYRMIFGKKKEASQEKPQRPLDLLKQETTGSEFDRVKKKLEVSTKILEEIKTPEETQAETSEETRPQETKTEPEKIELCNCGLAPQHTILEHDWCCQVCGGNHRERICPKLVGKPTKVVSVDDERLIEAMEKIVASMPNQADAGTEKELSELKNGLEKRIDEIGEREKKLADAVDKLTHIFAQFLTKIYGIKLEG